MKAKHCVIASLRRTASTVATHLQVHIHGLQALPLAQACSSQEDRPYTAPDAYLGRWTSMSATDAAAFLTEHLVTHHCEVMSRILSDSQFCSLMSSSQAQLALLRALRPSLPTTTDLRSHAAKAVALRIPFKDGYIDTTTHTFHPLPYRTSDYVSAVLPLCYADVARVTQADMDAATKLLSSWFGEPAELRYVIRQLSRALAPRHGDTQKAILLHVDTLGASQQEGNRGKTTLLVGLLQGLFGSRLCTVSPGASLTNGQSSAYIKRRSLARHPIAIECFDELSSSGSQAKQLDVSMLKYLTGGNPSTSSHLLWIACNPSNLPGLAHLAQTDPAFYSRLITIPARTLFDSAPHLADNIERLLPAVCKLLLEDHRAYMKEGLLPPATSMLAHKQLLTRCTSIPPGLTQSYVQYAKEWLGIKVIPAPGQTLVRETLAAVFLSQHLQQVTALHKQAAKAFALASLHDMVRDLVDTAMARLGYDATPGCYQDVVLVT